jgi:hypothetical protein
VVNLAGVQVLAEEDHPALCRWRREYLSDEPVRQCVPDRDCLFAISLSENRFPCFLLYNNRSKK